MSAKQYNWQNMLGSADVLVGQDSVQEGETLTARKFAGELIGCKHNNRKKRPSEKKGSYTEARYKAWDKANKKRQAAWKSRTHGIIYKLTSPSGKAYVGLTKHSLEHRIRIHKKRESGCQALKNAINKYGIEKFKTEILHRDVPIKDLPELERKEIAKHRTLEPLGYNLTPGGEHNELVAMSSRKKLSESKKKFWDDASDDKRSEANARMMSSSARDKVARTKLANTKKRLLQELEGIPCCRHDEYTRKFWAKYEAKRQGYMRRKSIGKAHPAQRRPAGAGASA